MIFLNKLFDLYLAIVLLKLKPTFWNSICNNEYEKLLSHYLVFTKFHNI